MRCTYTYHIKSLKEILFSLAQNSIVNYIKIIQIYEYLNHSSVISIVYVHKINIGRRKNNLSKLWSIMNENIR